LGIPDLTTKETTKRLHYKNSGKNLASILRNFAHLGKVCFANSPARICYQGRGEVSVAGLTLPQNNGMVEGKVNKLKLIKRMGYGRAGFPLLRQRVLHAL
jgi:hypothetical protein